MFQRSMFQVSVLKPAISTPFAGDVALPKS